MIIFYAVEALLESVRTQFIQYAEVKTANAQIALDEQKKKNDTEFATTKAEYDRLLLVEQVAHHQIFLLSLLTICNRTNQMR